MNPTGKILIVEDNPNVLELLEITLRFKGYPVATAHDGEEAISIIKQEHPALVITDILMPKMDGFALAHALRKDAHTAHIPIIFISATYVTPEDKAFALSLGAVRFIEKPIDTDDFLLTIAEIMTRGVAAVPLPLEDAEFFSRYRERLENKLRYKNTQIARTERLLESLPVDQKPAFESLLGQSIRDRDEIQRDINDLLKILGQ